MDSQPSQPLIERIFGANWRTTISGLAATASAIIIALSVLPKETWQNPSVAIPAVLLVVAKTIQDFKTKDANVAGTGAPLDPHRVDDGIAAPRKIPASLIVAFVGLSFFFLSACVTDPVTGKKSVDPRVQRASLAVLGNLAGDAGKLAVGALSQAVMEAASGDTNMRDLQQSAATGAWKSVGTIDVAADVANIVNAWNGGSAPQVAASAAAVFAVANPQTPADKAVVVNTIAQTISNAALSSPASGAQHRPHLRTDRALVQLRALPVLRTPDDTPVYPLVVTSQRN
jgi:hypothetical protein